MLKFIDNGGMFCSKLHFSSANTRRGSWIERSVRELNALRLKKNMQVLAKRENLFFSFTPCLGCKHAQRNQREKRATSSRGDNVNACDVTKKWWTREDTLFLQSFNTVEIVEIGYLSAMLENLLPLPVVNFLVVCFFFIWRIQGTVEPVQCLCVPRADSEILI